MRTIYISIYICYAVNFVTSEVVQLAPGRRLSRYNLKVTRTIPTSSLLKNETFHDRLFTKQFNSFSSWRHSSCSRGWHRFYRRRVPSCLSRVIFSLQRAVAPRLYFRGDDQLMNMTRVGITGNGDGSHDYRLTGLRKYTQYSVVVKAFNTKGDGPGSDPVTAHTFEDGEWKAPSSFIVLLAGFLR